MATAQVWRPAGDLASWVCRGRPPRPAPLPGTNIRDTITRVRVQALYTPPPPFTIGTTRPTALNTGATGNLTRYPASGDGNLVVTTAGAIIENLDVYGYIIVRAANVTVRNCRARGWSTAGFRTQDGQGLYGLITIQTAGATGCVVESCTLAPTVPQWWTVGVKGNYDFAVRRCNIYEVVDGIDAYETTGVLTAEGNYIHDLSFFDNSNDHANDAVHPYWTHNDCIQLSGGAGHTIRGNTLLGNASPDVGMPGTLTSNGYPLREIGVGVTVSPDKGAVTGALIELNWFDGGAAGFQMNGFYGGATSGNFGTIQNNRFGMGQHDYGNGSRYQIRYRNGYTIAGLTTNVWDAVSTVPANLQGQSFTVGFTGGIRVDN